MTLEQNLAIRSKADGKARVRVLMRRAAAAVAIARPAGAELGLCLDVVEDCLKIQIG